MAEGSRCRSSTSKSRFLPGAGLGSSFQEGKDELSLEGALLLL